MGIVNHNRVQEYVNKVCSQVKNKKVHEEIKNELMGHIDEIVSELLSKGINEEEAIDKAISQMGDAVAVGRQLHKVHKTKHEWSVLGITIIFAVFGLAIMYLMESKGALLYNNQAFQRTVLTTALGLLTAGGMYLVDFRKIKAYSWHIYIGTSLVFTYILNSGVHINGMKASLNLGIITVNWITVSQILFIIALAGIYDGWDWKTNKKCLLGLAIGIAPALFMIAAPSFAAGAMYLISLLIILAVSGFGLKYLTVMAVSGAGVFLYLGLSSFYRMERFLIFLHPGKDPQGAGWLNLQIYKAIHSAGFLGQGFKSLSVPEMHTDFIFTYIIYTFGWIAGILLAVLIIAFLVRITRIAAVTENNYGKLLVSGFASTFGIQFVWNILMNLNMAPIVGIALPFISYGGSQFIINMMAIAIILNVYKSGRGSRHIPTIH